MPKATARWAVWTAVGARLRAVSCATACSRQSYVIRMSVARIRNASAATDPTSARGADEIASLMLIIRTATVGTMSRTTVNGSARSATLPFRTTPLVRRTKPKELDRQIASDDARDLISADADWWLNSMKRPVTAVHTADACGTKEREIQTTASLRGVMAGESLVTMERGHVHVLRQAASLRMPGTRRTRGQPDRLSRSHSEAPPRRH